MSDWAKNPFNPGFGASPPLLVGRQDALEAFSEALDDGPGSLGRATLYTGARGAGKTVMLNAVEELARQRSWAVISETGTPGLVDRLATQHVPRLLEAIAPKGSKVTGLTMPLNLGGITFATVDDIPADLRTRMTVAADLLDQRHGAGLLITVDEIHPAHTGEFRDLAVAIQHAFREGRQVAFAGAGLSVAISDILNDEVLTFLRRADRYELGRVPRPAVAEGLLTPIRNAGRNVTDEALAVMVEGTQGYPFLIQLVGSRTWRLHPDREEIDVADAQEGVAQARRRLGSLVHAPALSSCSDVDKTFLMAMAQDNGPSKMADIQQRMQTDANYAGQYRLRLIAQELIQPVGHGKVDFTIPYLREYLREHATSDLDW